MGLGGKRDSREMDRVMSGQASYKGYDPIIDGVCGGGLYRQM